MKGGREIGFAVSHIVEYKGAHVGTINSYRDLVVWQKGKRLATLIYRATEKMPRSELFGLTNQMRRAAVSIPSNIAEGYNRKTRLEYIRGLRIASGSQGELLTQWEIAAELGYLKPNSQVTGLISEMEKMLTVLIARLQAKGA